MSRAVRDQSALATATECWGRKQRASLEGASYDPLLAERARRMGDEGYAHRSCAPGVRTRDQSNCEIKGGAPSTGAVGATCVPFQGGTTSMLDRTIYEAVLAWAKRTSPGDRLRSNRWVGRVEKERRVGRVKNVRAVGDQSAPAPTRERACLDSPF